MKNPPKMEAIWCVCVLFIGCATPARIAPEAILSGSVENSDFTYSFVLEPSDPLQLRIVLEIMGDADGRTDLKSALHFGPLFDVPELIDDVVVLNDGNPVEVVHIDDGHWQVSHAPDARLRVSWRIKTRGADESGPPRDIFYRPYLDRFGMHVFGVAVLLVPTGRESALGTLDWEGFDGWKTTSGAQIDAQERVGFTTFVRSTFLAGPELHILERDLSGGLLRLGILGAFAFDNDALANELQMIVSMQRDYFRDPTDSYVFVSVLENGVEFDQQATQRMETGTNLLRSFATMLRGKATLEGNSAINTHHLFMHEMLHNWIGSRIYAVEGGSVNAAWFVEGFTHLLTWSMLKQTGLATPEQVEKTIHRIAENYLNSPFKNTPNSVAGPEFFKGRDGHEIAYNRGAVIAAWFALRLAEHQSDLRSFLHEMVVRSAQDPFNEATLRAFVAESTNDATAHQMFTFAIDGRTIENPLDVLTRYFALIPEPK